MSQKISKKLYEQWKITNGWISGNLEELSDDDLKKSVIPGKNHGVWILGHLIQCEDELSKFLGKEDYIYPENEELFGQGSKLLPVESYPDVKTLRKQWEGVKKKNDRILAQFEDEEWDEVHGLSESAGSDDFFKTKGRCIMIWNLHQMYHNGQLAMLLSLAGKAKF